MKLHVGDYIETLDGAVGFITKIDEDKNGFSYNIVFRSDSHRIYDEYSYDLTHREIGYDFKRIGSYTYEIPKEENKEAKEHDCQTVSCCEQEEFKEIVSKMLNDGYEISSSSCNDDKDWKAILVK